MSVDAAVPAERNLVVGLPAALSVIFIWSSWLVVSRAGALTTLTPYDLAAMRYGVAAIFALPIVLYFKPWRTMSLTRIIAVTVLLGPVYVLLIFGGFEFAPASHGGIFMNGALPVITLVIAWVWLSERPSARQLIAAAVILLGVTMTVGDASFNFLETWLGDVMFIGGAIFFCLYVTVSKLWNVTMTQVLLCSAVLNALTFVPVWYFFLPSGIAEASQSEFWLQFLFQGLVPNLFGLLMIALSARHLGPANTAAFMASVPALGALLSVYFLGESLGFISWVGIAVLSAGILMMTLGGRRKLPRQDTLTETSS